MTAMQLPSTAGTYLITVFSVVSLLCRYTWLMGLLPGGKICAYDRHYIFSFFIIF